MLFMCAPLLHIWRALPWSNVKNWWYRGSNRYHQCPLKGGRGWKSLYFTCPGTSILIPFDCGPTPPCLHMILVVWRHGHICDRNTFLNPASSRFAFALIHVAAQIHCSTLGWVAINRGLTPVAWHLLATSTYQLQMQCHKPVTYRKQPDTTSDKHDKNVFKFYTYF